MKKNSKVAKATIIAFISILLLTLIGSLNTYAAENIFSLVNVEIVEKSETVEVEKLGYEKDKINANIIYHKVGDYVKYKITIQNNKNEDYKFKSITDNNSNSYISYEFADCSNTELKANSTSDLYVTVKYLKSVDDIANRNQDINVDFDITIVDKDGNVVSGTISMNAQTGDPIMVYIIILCVSALMFVLLSTLNAKDNKRSRKIFGFVIAIILVTPIVVNAAGSSLTVNLKGCYILKDKVIVTYTDEKGSEINKVVDYGNTAEEPDALEKENYDFVGWFDENDKKVEGQTNNLVKDTKLTPKWKAKDFTITYNVDDGETQNPTTYTIESNDVVLTEPTREGYTFIGWTGDNGETPEKEVTIPKGSTNNKTFTANWTPIEYTIEYILNDGVISGEVTSYTIESEDIVLPIPTKAKQGFIGWTGTELEAETKTVTIPKGSTGNRTYTANWKDIGPTEITVYKYPNTEDYMFFNTGTWKSTSETRSPYNWSIELPCLVFDEEITRARMGYSNIEYVTYNSQSYANGFVSTDKKRMWFDNHYGGLQEGYYTVGYTQNNEDHEVRFQISGGVITDFQIIY